jgi:hypothetical protein
MSAEAIAQERREECRKAVLGFLAERQAVAHHPKTIRQRLNAGHEHDFADEEVEAALAFLLGMRPEPFAKEIPDGMGATRYYQATSAGVIAHERI